MVEEVKNWSDFKVLVNTKILDIQYVEFTEAYSMYCVESVITYKCIVYKNTADATDFEDNYKEKSNKPIASKNIISEDMSHVNNYFQMRGCKLSVGANSSNSVELSWPYNIRLLAIFLYPEHDGDEATGVLAENTIVGAITVNVAIDDTEIEVADTVRDNVGVGFWLKLDDGTNSQDFMIIEKDGNTLTLSEPSDYAFLVTTPTICKMTIKMSYDKVPLKGGVMCKCGGTSIGGSLMLAGVKFKLTYWNNYSEAVDVYYKLEYKY